MHGMLEKVQEDLQLDAMNQHLLEEERALSAHYRKVLSQEIDFYKQKAKAAWYKGHDANTKMFHAYVKVR